MAQYPLACESSFVIPHAINAGIVLSGLQRIAPAWKQQIIKRSDMINTRYKMFLYEYGDIKQLQIHFPPKADN